MAHALIIGCGAIGRGFVPWILQNFEVDFHDASRELTAGISAQGGYSSYMSDGENLSHMRVTPRKVTADFGELNPADYDIAFISVGPRNVERLPAGVSRIACPIYSLENDPITVDCIKQRYGLEAVYFGVPDVITSSTAAPESLAKDRYAIHTENGVMYLQHSDRVSDSLKAALPNVKWLPVERLNQEWDAKLYIHNTPHCIAAYLGFIAGCTYVHEALAKPAIRRVVDGVIEELLYALKVTTHYDHHFIESYAEKEVRRFANRLLFDPVSRVAREPIRKLHPSGRLTGALRLLLSAGVRPVYLTIGIGAALHYMAKDDKDFRQLSHLDEFGLPAFLQYHLSLRPDSLESRYIEQSFAGVSAYLRREIA
ncbi:mannitol-1-phosphate 5-dehydrogenase [Mycobacterium sp. SMC-2]|uniref:mannitol dehydrogenase family protein n=1 Tax=Mycobacterium sp. SMC-2 TaxID=2857058 RepID=UPI0021B20F1F|nr:mannitol-1-phosphate 5-dehydrogenase [Mycobacterium sp. SMC-2]UXA04237.1 mannitol-1-phosphate 5-dehydrogenase [Mycobacterium sp. SMC-2]